MPNTVREEILDNNKKAIKNALKEKDKEMFLKLMLDLHPSIQADIFVLFDEEEKRQTLLYMSPKELSKIFIHLNIEDQKRMFNYLEAQKAFDMFNRLYTDQKVHFLKNIDENWANDIVKHMSEENSKKLESVISYKKGTAGAVMTHELIRITMEKTVKEVFELLKVKVNTSEIIYYIYIVDDNNHLVGVISLRDLLTLDSDAIVKDVMKPHVISVDDDLHQEEVGKVIQKYDLIAIPVVSTSKELLGIVTVDDVMDILEQETTEDFGELTATKGTTSITGGAFQVAKKRTPWILLLMFLGLITGSVIQRFEDTLESVVLLAFFMPMIMDSAGNVGTQSLAVSVRGLALNEVNTKNLWRMVRREFLSGAMMGALCMILISGIVYLIYGNGILGLVVGVSIFVTLAISAVVGAIIPLVINKMKIDPAVASGPFITTLNDIIGLMIYFSIAKYFMNLL